MPCSPPFRFPVAELVHSVPFLFEVFLDMLTIKCLFLPHRKWNIIRVNVRNTNAIGSEKHSVGDGARIVL